MGRKLKKGKTGNAAQYLTRTQAIRKLQLRLAEFRRLCILKGVHPREPKKKVHGADKTYYHVKDVNFLLHEPLLAKFRDLKAYDKKVRKARAKQNYSLARRLMENKPGYRLDHLVKERYPSFVDALRDMDDPLTMVHLFAVLPAEQRHDIPVKSVETSRRLALEFQAWVVRTHSLRKMFISVKGFYYQAEVMGQTVTWLVPHQLPQLLPPDVDYRVMLTFLEFYQTVLQFVNFKLYHSLGLKYPPVLDAAMEEAAAGLAAIMQDLAGISAAERGPDPAQAPAAEVDPQLQQRIDELQSKLAELEEGGDGEDQVEAKDLGLDSDEGEEDDDDDDDEELPGIDSGDEESEEGEEEEPAAAMDADEAAASDPAAERTGVASVSGMDAEARQVAGGALGVDADDEAAVCASLFKGLVFFLNREVPREPLLFIIRAFGGVAAWDGEGSPHAEGDEAITHQVIDRPNPKLSSAPREYVQPQWVVDSANFRVLMPVDLYTPGKVPPPHLSPFVNNDEEGYTPDFAVTVQRLQEAAKMARKHAAGALQEAVFTEGAEGEAGPGGRGDAGDDLEAAERTYQADLSKELAVALGAAAPHVEAEEEEQEEEEPAKKSRAAKKRKGAAAEEEDDAGMSKAVMTRKTRKLYESVVRAQAQKQDKIDTLKRKKAQLA